MKEKQVCRIKVFSQDLRMAVKNGWQGEGSPGHLAVAARLCRIFNENFTIWEGQFLHCFSSAAAGRSNETFNYNQAMVNKELESKWTGKARLSEDGKKKPLRRHCIYIYRSIHR